MGNDAANEFGFTLDLSIEIKAKIEKVYLAVLGKLREFPGEKPEDVIRFTLEEWPGGRWFRDLGDGKGHHWGFVQAIKPPTLIELYGPLFMSLPVANNVQLRLVEMDGTVTVNFKHQAFGPIPEEYRSGMKEGWGQFMASIKTEVEQG